MARWAIGDVQGCGEELEALLAAIEFSADRDQLWMVGDLVNRGPRSLQVLRRLRALADSAVCVLGNHDLHLLAVALAGAKLRKSDTLAPILAAPDRDRLLEWLLQRPLAHYRPRDDSAGAHHGDLLIHAGVAPPWTLTETLAVALEVAQALRDEPRALLSQMYGDQPDRWDAELTGVERRRFAINVLTRMRFCTREGRIDLQLKGKPDSASPPWMPWYRVPRHTGRGVRIVCGHWSALGLHRGDGICALDTGCVWGGALTAVNLDDAEAAPISVPSRQPRSTEA